MKLHIEARTATWHEGAVTLRPNEQADYLALGSDAEREEWLDEYAREVVHERDVAGPTDIETITFRLEET